MNTNYLLIPVYGILGAAIATGISLFIISLIRIIEVYHLMKVHPFHVSLWKPLVAASVAMFALIFPMTSGSLSIFSIFSSITVFIILYAMMNIILRLDDNDKYIISLFKNRITCVLKIFA